MVSNNLFLNARRLYSNHNTRRVVVTGVGAVSPLGENVNSSWNNLIKERCGISRLDAEEFNGLPCQVIAKINKKTLNIESKISSSTLKSMSPATALVLVAAEEALNDAKLKDIDDSVKDRIGNCIGMGMLDLSDIYNTHEAFKKGYNKVSPYFIPRILPNMACGHVSIKYNFRGPIHSVSTACATGAHAIGDAFNFIKYNKADIMLCGSGESCIDPLSIAGFCRIRALSTAFNNEPEKSSRPFDKCRDGFVMGEGAAILVLEELDFAKARGANIYAEIKGYGLSGDAYHLTSPRDDGKGAILAMSNALADAGITPKEINYINAHATSTPTGDKIEATAINKLFSNNLKQISVSSTKGAHGHLLGAAGSLETVFVVLACKHNILPPSINIESKEDGIDFRLVQKAENWEVKQPKIALKNSFGFGGTNACLCVSEYND